MLQTHTILHCFLSPPFCDNTPYFSESAKKEGNILRQHVKNVLTTAVAGQRSQAMNMTSTHGGQKRYICRSIDAYYRSNYITVTTFISTYLFRYATFICPNPKSALEVLSPPLVHYDTHFLATVDWRYGGLSLRISRNPAWASFRTTCPFIKQMSPILCRGRKCKSWLCCCDKNRHLSSGRPDEYLLATNS